jgi:hypothetical protein
MKIDIETNVTVRVSVTELIFIISEFLADFLEDERFENAKKANTDISFLSGEAGVTKLKDCYFSETLIEHIFSDVVFPEDGGVPNLKIVLSNNLHSHTYENVNY